MRRTVSAGVVLLLAFFSNPAHVGVTASPGHDHSLGFLSEASAAPSWSEVGGVDFAAYGRVFASALVSLFTNPAQAQAPAPAATGPKFHLLVVADTQDPDIGAHAATDLVSVFILAKAMASSAGLEFSATALTSGGLRLADVTTDGLSRNPRLAKLGPVTADALKHTKDIDPKTIEKTLKALKIGPDDVLWFQFSGRGFR